MKIDYTVLQFKRFALSLILEIISQIDIFYQKEDDFIKREPTPLMTYETIESLTNQIKEKMEHLNKNVPNKSELTSKLNSVIALVNDSNNALDLLNKFHSVLIIIDTWLPELTSKKPDSILLSASKDKIYISLENINEVVNILDYTSELINQYRDNKLVPTLEELTLIHSSYFIAINGERLPDDYMDLGTSGFRSIQTHLSIADPGDGHINITTRDADLLNGSIVHIEHIDRDKEANKEIIEPYRLPAIKNVVKIKLNTGASAPCTAFIGRPIFENYKLNSSEQNLFDVDLLKTSHIIASTCTAMFSYGIADCKIAIERMSVRQSLKFMKALVGNVVRDESRQYLSAAFNINTSIIDDRGKKPIEITDPVKICEIGIFLAVESGFNKVTWDGASNQIPSVPIIDQLPFRTFVDLIHKAHENGLETYISAGLQPSHMNKCVYTGVGGVGIGTSLHYRDPETKLMGALKPDAIKAVLSNRDIAGSSVRGKGAKLLAQLDRMYFEKVITEKENELRNELFLAIKDENESKIKKLLDSNSIAFSSGQPFNNPVINQGMRLLESTEKSLLFKELGKEEFTTLKEQVYLAVKTNNIQALTNQLKI